MSKLLEYLKSLNTKKTYAVIAGLVAISGLAFYFGYFDLILQLLT